ncbi:MAG: hypothetical protein ACREUQ_13790 [Burkholderiales bacterium]
MLPIARLARTHACGAIRTLKLLSRFGSGLATTFALVTLLAAGANAQQNACPPDISDSPALLKSHLSQADLAAGKVPFKDVFRFGQLLFITNFNKCDGAGRPGTNGAAALHGVGALRTPDPLEGPRFTILSSPDSSSCASCHNEPAVGGAGSFHSNLFDPAADCVPVAGIFLNRDLHDDVPPANRPCRPAAPPTASNGFFGTFQERGSLGLFGSGAIELLAREMTQDMFALRDQAIAQAQAAGTDVVKPLVTKGVNFGSLTAHSDGTVATGGVQGVSPDLVVRTMGRKGQNKSIRHFSIQAFNRHLGIQPQESVADFSPGDPDPDQDGVSNEFTVGDMTAATVFMAALPVPRRAQVTGQLKKVVDRGDKLFEQVGCASCHIPELKLNSTIFCEPNPLNTDGDFQDQSQKYCFDLAKTSDVRGNLVVGYTDLKRHTICDPSRSYDPITNHFCDDPPVNPVVGTDPTGPGSFGSGDRPKYYQFLTAKLWDVGNSGPWGHRNDLDTIYEAIVAHGGEATASIASYAALSSGDQLAVVKFLETLRMPIMENNPLPQEIGSPRASNPGGGAPLQ